jgi:hypothetical protein
VEDTTEADKGTLCHTIAECHLKYLCKGGQFVSPWPNAELAEYPEADQAYFVEVGKMAAQWVFDLVKELGVITTRLEWKIKSDVVPEHGGTVDVCLVTPELIHIVDYKFGRVEVNPEGNKQLLSYLCLVRQEFGPRPVYRATIAQPSNWPPETAEFTDEDLDDHLVDVIYASTQDHKQAGQHCQYCHLLGSCAVQAKALRDELDEFPPIDPDDPEPDLDLVARCYLVGKIADKMVSNAGQILKHWAAKGEKLPRGLNIRTTIREYWTDQAPSHLSCPGNLPEDVQPSDLFTDPSPRSPAETRRIMDMTREEFRAEFDKILELKPIRVLVIGKGGQKEFPEFDDFPE